MSERYQNCPVCGSLCMIGGDKKEGTHYYVPASGNAEFAAAPAAKAACQADFQKRRAR